MCSRAHDCDRCGHFWESAHVQAHSICPVLQMTRSGTQCMSCVVTCTCFSCTCSDTQYVCPVLQRAHVQAHSIHVLYSRCRTCEEELRIRFLCTMLYVNILSVRMHRCVRNDNFFSMHATKIILRKEKKPLGKMLRWDFEHWPATSMIKQKNWEHAVSDHVDLMCCGNTKLTW